MSETSTTEREQLLKTYQEYEELWNGDYSKLDLVSESIAFYDPGVPDGMIHGREAFEAYLRSVRSAFPDWYVDADNLLAEGEIVMKEWTVTATHEGEYRGVPPTHREIEIKGMAKDVIRNGKVEEARLYYDPQQLSEQLGLTEE
ncbi:ester cyclase [Haloarcula nitratireducens]|uniref:Ester cyclase n=1 Tax=Haloarcula nitratireducens TaxID=2487749 RepID=A0AAW4PL47_9EURY|nr:ester cyclase [Halomicroarcula nitratireducens]MBX0298025.1 ester cyclase [Halomicroarcula nitratireducens]